MKKSFLHHDVDIFDVLDGFSDGVIIVDENFVITYLNEICSLYLGSESNEFMGRTLMEIHSLYKHNQVFQILKDFSKGAHHQWEKIIFLNERFLKFQVNVIYNKEKVFKGIVCAIHDITKLRKREQSHDNLYKMYSIIFTSTQLAMITIDKTGRISSFNPAAEKLLNIEKAQVLNENLNDVFFNKQKYDEKGNYNSQLIETVETGKEYHNFKKEIVSNGENFTMLLHTCVLYDAAGKVIGTLGVFSDITDYNFQQNQIHRQEKYEAMAQLAAGLADEMRNPLTSIKGFMQLVHDRMRKNRQKEYVELALDELRRVERLIRNFLLFSRPDAPLIKLANINRLLTEIVNEYKSNFKNIEFEVTVPQEDFFMCLDEEQIKQALINLLQNAVEALPAQGGKIIVVMSVLTSPSICISIEDNGSGILPQNWPHIYEPFYTTKDYNSGLGLTIAQRIIMHHGGVIDGETNAAGGATMKVCLPFNVYVSQNSVKSQAKQ